MYNVNNLPRDVSNGLFLLNCLDSILCEFLLVTALMLGSQYLTDVGNMSGIHALQCNYLPSHHLVTTLVLSGYAVLACFPQVIVTWWQPVGSTICL